MRIVPPSGLGFLNCQWRRKLAARYTRNAAAKYFRYDGSRLTRTIYTIIRELIGREALCVKRAEAGFIAEKRAARHGHAAGKKDGDGSVQPDDRDTGIAEKFGSAWLRVGSATESDNRGFAKLHGTAQRSTQLFRFQLTKGGLAVAFKEFRDGDAASFLDALVQVHKAPSELPSQAGANGAFTRPHETGETNDCGARLSAAPDKSLIHDSE
jgi:hypothetical protein